jgi:phage terminase large subunit
VHKLLKDQIEALGLGWFYQVLETRFAARTARSSPFPAWRQHTIESIKSFEGVRHRLGRGRPGRQQASWDVLIPTIRKPGSKSGSRSTLSWRRTRLRAVRHESAA